MLPFQRFPCIVCRRTCIVCKMACQKYDVWIVLHVIVYKLQNSWHERTKIVIKNKFTEIY